LKIFEGSEFWETGASPVRARRCERGLSPNMPLVVLAAGKAGEYGDPQARRPV